MKILTIADTHTFHQDLKIPGDLDMIIHAGDWTNTKNPAINHGEGLAFLDWFQSLDVKHKVLIGGNHDTALEAGLIKREDIESRGITYLLHEYTTIEGKLIFGSPYTPEFHNWAFNVRRDRMYQYWDELIAGIDLLITHGKSTKIIKAVKLFKFAKPLVTVLSVVLSASVYAIAYNPLVGVGLVVLIFIHEMGHVMAMNKEGFKTNGPVFIPFLGAALFAPKEWTRRQEAFIGIMGPVIGSVGAFLFVGLYLIFRTKWMLVLAYLGIFINLFNMIPISPMDGGRITQAVGKWFQIVGITILLIFSIIMKQPGILLIWIIVFFDIRFLHAKLRFGLGCMAELAMIFFLLTGIGIGKGEFWPTLVDAIVGGVYLLIISTSVFNVGIPMAERNEEDDQYNRDPLTRRARTQWFVSWIGLSLVLIVSMMLLTPYLK